MNPIFDITSTAARFSATVSANPDQPYLAHHDVGVPLLGTVMSLEAMAECTAHFCGRIPKRIAAVAAGQDCLVPAAKDLLFTAEAYGDAFHTCLADGTDRLFSCAFSFVPPAVPSLQVPPAGEFPVTAGTIYSCFFHGPAFQVVDGAQLSGDILISRFNPSIPPLTLDPSRTSVLPVRTIEFCLQTAGLLDIALCRYLSVPLSIGEVRLYDADDVAGLWAQAKKNGLGTDIHAFNSSGQAVLSVLDYRTKPMPYESRELDELHQSFHPLFSLYNHSLSATLKKMGVNSAFVEEADVTPTQGRT